MRTPPLTCLALCAGCYLPCTQPLAPAAAPASAAAPTANTPGLVIDYPRACVIRDGELAVVEVEYHPRTRDTTYQGVPFAQAFPLTAEYAGAAEWFTREETITFGGREYRRYGPAREMSYVGLRRIGEYRGVGVFGTSELPDAAFILLPVRPSCVFQAYMSPYPAVPSP